MSLPPRLRPHTEGNPCSGGACAICPTSPFLLLCSPRADAMTTARAGMWGRPAGNPPPPPPPLRGAPLWFEPVSPDCVGVGAVEDSPSPQGLAATGACAREMQPPLPRTGKAQVKNKLLCACAQLPSLSPPPGAGDFPLLVRRRGPGFQAMRLCYRTKAVAWSFRTCLRNIYFDTVSLYMAQPRFGLTAILLPQNGESHHTWLWSFLFSLQELACVAPHALQWAPRPYSLCWLLPVTRSPNWPVGGSWGP